MALFLHEVLAGFENPKGDGFGLFNRNRYPMESLHDFSVVKVRDRPYTRGSELPRKYFVSGRETEDCWVGEWVTGCRTVGRITETMIVDYEWLGGREDFTGYAAIYISPRAWEQLESGELEKLLPRHLRERNAGNRNLWAALRDPGVEKFVSGKEDRWHTNEFMVGERGGWEWHRKKYKLAFTTTPLPHGKWNGTDRPVTNQDWVLGIDRKGWLWCRLFEEGDILAQWQPSYSDCPFPHEPHVTTEATGWMDAEVARRYAEWEESLRRSVWVREDDPRFWVKTVGRDASVDI